MVLSTLKSQYYSYFSRASRTLLSHTFSQRELLKMHKDGKGNWDIGLRSIWGFTPIMYTNTISLHFGPNNLLLKWQIIITCITSFTVFSNYNEGDLTINVLAPKGTFVCTRQLDPGNWVLKLGKISRTALQIFWQSSTLCTIQKWNSNICIWLISLIQTNYIVSWSYMYVILRSSFLFFNTSTTWHFLTVQHD